MIIKAKKGRVLRSEQKRGLKSDVAALVTKIVMKFEE